MTARGDFLVIGSGIAGLRAALSLAEAGRVIILTKADPGESNTGYAQGGIAAAMSDDDSPELHARDTMAAGDNLCRPEAVDVLVHDGPRYVRELIEWGAEFDRDESGTIAFGREAAHSVRRVLHARDATGREIGRVLWQRVSAHPSVNVYEDAQALSLRVRDGACTGATFVGRDGSARHVTAPRTLIATGGAGQVFRETTNPAVATGDGVAMAFEAGAQRQPTSSSCSFIRRFSTFLAPRGSCCRKRFAARERTSSMPPASASSQRYEPAGDLASRDLVVAAIVREMQRTGAPVFLTMAHLDPAVRAPQIPDDHAGVRPGRARPRHRPHSREPRRSLHDGRCRNRPATGGRRSKGCSPPARWRAPASTAPTVWPAIRCWRASCSGPARRRRCARPVERPSLGGPVPRASTRRRAPAHSCPSRSDDVRDVMWRHVGLVRTRDGLEDAVARLGEWRSAVGHALASRSMDREHRTLASLVLVGPAHRHGGAPPRGKPGRSLSRGFPGTRRSTLAQARLGRTSFRLCTSPTRPAPTAAQMPNAEPPETHLRHSARFGMSPCSL